MRPKWILFAVRFNKLICRKVGRLQRWWQMLNISIHCKWFTIRSLLLLSLLTPDDAKKLILNWIKLIKRKEIASRVTKNNKIYDCRCSVSVQIKCVQNDALKWIIEWWWTCVHTQLFIINSLNAYSYIGVHGTVCMGCRRLAFFFFINNLCALRLASRVVAVAPSSSSSYHTHALHTQRRRLQPRNYLLSGLTSVGCHTLTFTYRFCWASDCEMHSIYADSSTWIDFVCLVNANQINIMERKKILIIIWKLAVCKSYAWLRVFCLFSLIFVRW